MTIAREISSRIKSELGITASIGVANNKITAKLGSDYKKPDAITRIEQDNYKEIVYPLPVEDLLYVGPATSKKLRAIGIDTIGRLAECSEGGWSSVCSQRGGMSPLCRRRIIFQTSSPSATVPLRPGTWYRKAMCS